MANEQVIIREVRSAEPHAMSLRRAREIHAKQEGVLHNPKTGKWHPFSLDQWADRDPDETFLLVSIRFVDPAKVGTTHPNFKR